MKNAILGIGLLSGGVYIGVKACAYVLGHAIVKSDKSVEYLNRINTTLENNNAKIRIVKIDDSQE